jgi:hypothetical protein
LTEMPTTEELRSKVKLTVYECPEFTIDAVIFGGNRMHLHLDWPGRKLTPSLYKKGLMAISMIRKGCRENGIEAIYTLVPESLVKWETMFGFEAVEKWTNKVNPDQPLYLMKQVA